MSVSRGNKITPNDIINLKNLVFTEIWRRSDSRSTGSMASYHTSAYDYYTTPAIGGKILLEHITKITKPLDAVTGGSTTPGSGAIVTAGTITNAANQVATLSGKGVTSSDTGCKSSCSGLCSSGCYTNCKGTCTGNCTSTCSGSCTGTCNNTCSGTCSGSCSGSCGGACSSSCSGGCSGCDGDCNGCEGCGGSCSSKCWESDCSGTCSVHCNDEAACSNDCDNFCANVKW